MRNYLIPFLLLTLISNAANGQWIQIYQTDTCTCPEGQHLPVIGMGFFGKDSGIVWSKKYGDNGSVATTTNGGKTWDTYRLVSNVTGSSAAFTDINHLWLNDGNIIYHSSDGGRNWRADTLRDTISSNITSLYFLDSLTGFAGGEGLMIFKTSDGGIHWNRVRDPDKNIQNGLYEIHHFSFSTPLLGLAIGADYHSYVLRTTDGGLNWLTVSDLDGVSAEAFSLSYPDWQHAYICTAYYLYSSSDSGKTWGQVGSRLPLGAFFRSISFLDSLRGIAVVSDSPLVAGYTSDGGKSWRRFTTSGSTTSYLFSSSSFPHESIAYVGGSDAIFKLNTKDLSVAPHQPISNLCPSLEFDGDYIVIGISGEFPGVVRVLDLLGRVVEERTIASDSKIHLSLSGVNRQAFIEVRSQNQFKVFKILR